MYTSDEIEFVKEQRPRAEDEDRQRTILVETKVRALELGDDFPLVSGGDDSQTLT